MSNSVDFIQDTALFWASFYMAVICQGPLCIVTHHNAVKHAPVQTLHTPMIVKTGLKHHIGLC